MCLKLRTVEKNRGKKFRYKNERKMRIHTETHIYTIMFRFKAERNFRLFFFFIVKQLSIDTMVCTIVSFNYLPKWSIVNLHLVHTRKHEIHFYCTHIKWIFFFFFFVYFFLLFSFNFSFNFWFRRWTFFLQNVRYSRILS